MSRYVDLDPVGSGFNSPPRIGFNNGSRNTQNMGVKLDFLNFLQNFLLVTNFRLFKVIIWQKKTLTIAFYPLQNSSFST